MNLSFFPKGVYYIEKAIIKYKYPNTLNLQLNSNAIPYAISILNKNNENENLLWDILAFRPDFTLIEDELKEGIEVLIFYERYETLTSTKIYHKIPRYIYASNKSNINNENNRTSLWFINIR